MRGTKASILVAARELFLTEGVEAVSMRRIAQKVGVTATAIYRHFENKAALLDAVADRGFDALIQYFATVPEDPETVAYLRGLAQVYFRFAIDHPEDYRFIFVIQRSNARRFPEDFRARRSASFDLAVAAIEEGIQRGEIRAEDPVELALSVWAHVHGMVGLFQAGRFDHDASGFSRILDRSLTRLFDGIKAPTGGRS
jgi:AcrR family transcriptional regulator